MNHEITNTAEVQTEVSSKTQQELGGLMLEGYDVSFRVGDITEGPQTVANDQYTEQGDYVFTSHPNAEDPFQKAAVYGVGMRGVRPVHAVVHRSGIVATPETDNPGVGYIPNGEQVHVARVPHNLVEAFAYGGAEHLTKSQIIAEMAHIIVPAVVELEKR